MTRRLLSLLFLLALAVAPLHAQATPARDSALEAATRAVASQLRCPVCQGLSIEDSPSELSQQMRALVREQLRAGQSPEAVKQYFVSKYGDWILLSPPAHGVDFLVYALPLLALACGAAFVAFAVRRWSRAPVDAERSPGPVGDITPS